MLTLAEVKDVVDRIVHEVRSPAMQQRLIDNVTDLSLSDSSLLYNRVEFGENTNLTKKRQLDIDWTDHAEYRGELRDVDPKRMNEMVKEKLRTKLLKNPNDRGKTNFKGPEGVAVVDYDLSRNPAEADIVTTWASEKVASELVRIAKELVAAKLRITKSIVDQKATNSLRSLKLKARSRGDMQGAIISAGYYAKKQGTRMWVYPNVSYGTGVWQVTYKEGDAFNPINNAIGLTVGRKGKIFSIDPDLTVTVHDVEA